MTAASKTRPVVGWIALALSQHLHPEIYSLNMVYEARSRAYRAQKFGVGEYLNKQMTPKHRVKNPLCC